MKNNFPQIDHIYIHVPFCRRKCGYCSFYSEIFSAELKQKFLSNLQQEIILFQKEFYLKPKTIYFGGGTPSLLAGTEINLILQNFDLSEIQEITLEANPINITKKYADEIFQTPINRLSLGIQSFLDKELKLLGRLHDAKQAENAFQILRKNDFQNISLDLIYGLPKQTKNDLLFSLEKFIEFNPEHVSTYCLSLEKDVPMFPQKTAIPPDEMVSGFYYLIRDKLLAAGYLQYEISNFAKPGFGSKHNLCYWNDKFYLGLGAAASGYIEVFHPACHVEELRRWERSGRIQGKKKIIRYSNPADLKEYFRQIERKQICSNPEEIDPETHEKEYVFLALRKTKGLDIIEFRKKFAVNFLEKYKLIIEKYRRQNLLEIEGDFVKLTPSACFISNEILSEFV